MTNCRFGLSGKAAALNEKIVAFWNPDDENFSFPDHFPYTYDEKVAFISIGPSDDIGVYMGFRSDSILRIVQREGYNGIELALTLTKKREDGTLLTDDWELGPFREIYLCSKDDFDDLVTKYKEEHPTYASAVFEDFYHPTFFISPSEMRSTISGDIRIAEWTAVFAEQVSLT